MAIPQPSQTAAPHPPSIASPSSGGDSALFSFLDQVPSPAMGGQQHLSASLVRCSYPYLCILTNAAEQPSLDFLENIPASQRVTVQVPPIGAEQPQDDLPQVRCHVPLNATIFLHCFRMR
jgi:hypothetical protein